MNPYDELDRKAREAESLQDAAKVLHNLLAGGYSVWTDGRLYSIRQLVAQVNGLQIHVYADEHAPPHFHVKSSDIDAAFTIHDCTFMRGNLNGREQRLVHWWYERSRHQLIAAWNSSRPSDCTVGSIRE